MVEGYANLTALFSDGLEDALTDPPNCIGDKFEATRFIKTTGGFQETQVALIDEVTKCEATVLIASLRK